MAFHRNSVSQKGPTGPAVWPSAESGILLYTQLPASAYTPSGTGHLLPSEAIMLHRNRRPYLFCPVGHMDQEQETLQREGDD